MVFRRFAQVIAGRHCREPVVERGDRAAEWSTLGAVGLPMGAGVGILDYGPVVDGICSILSCAL
jgi:hypothetical protein